MRVRIQTCLFGIIIAFVLTTSVKAQTFYDSLDVKFSVNLSIAQQLGVYNPEMHTPKIAGSFTDWQNGALDLVDEGDTVFSLLVPFNDVTSGSFIEYKFILVDTAGTIYWEKNFGTGSNNREYVFSETEADLTEDGVPDVLLEHNWNDYALDLLNGPRPEEPAPEPNKNSDIVLSLFSDSYDDVLVDTWRTDWSNSILLDEAIDGNAVKRYLALDFNGIETVSQQLDLTNQNHISLDVWTSNATTFRVKLVDFGADGAFDGGDDSEHEIAFDNLPLNSWNTLNIPLDAFEGLASRSNIAQIIISAIPVAEATVFLDNVFFFTDPFSRPPYEIGDIVNYNGSFELNELGPVAERNEGWYFETVNGPSTYEIVDNAQDGDGKAALAMINFDGSEDIWRAQVVNEPVYPAEGDLYSISFWMKSSDEGSITEAFLGLPVAGNFEDVNTHFFHLTTEWNEYSFHYFASETDENLGLRVGFKLNFEANNGDSIYIDNLNIEKIEAVYTPVTFSVNTAVQQELSNFNTSDHVVGLVGSFNGWDTGAPIIMETTPGDTIFTGTVELLNATVGDEIRYKYILKDDSTGVFQWESPDPENPETDGEFSDRVTNLDNLSGMNVPAVYFNDIDRTDLDVNNYGTTSIIDARMSVYGSHLAIQGIVTRVTNNFVYVQDGTAATTLFSRPFFSDANSLSFNLATKEGNIAVGDELKVAGVTTDYNGLHELINIHSWEVVSTDNPLPEPQLMDINEYSNNGEEYESEIVRIEHVRILDPVDSLFGGYVYEITNEDETQIGWMSIQGSFNSEWAWQPAPQEFFNIEAVVKEFYIPSLGHNIYAVSIHNESDIEEIASDFDAEFAINSFASLPGFNESLNIDLIDLGDEPIQGMEFTINFDPNLVDVTLSDQTGTVLEGVSLVTNTLNGQILVAFATDGTPENDITETGAFLHLNVEVLAVGETEIVISDILINERPSPDIVSFLNIVPRLCGDVTGDVTVSPEDATLVLQHTVKLNGVFPLVELDSTAADVTGNGDISAFDASLILQKTVGLRDNLGCVSLPLKDNKTPVSASWLMAESEAGYSVVSVDLSQNEFGIYAIQMELDITEGTSFKSIRNLPDNWIVITNSNTDRTFISLYGVSPMDQESIELEFNTEHAQSVPKVKANLVVNERTVPELNELLIGDVPSEFGLNQNYPNPFNPSTNISYTLSKKSDVELSIFNMLGQKIATIVNQTQDAGTYTVSWQAGSMSSGVYIYRLNAGGKSFTKRMMLIK